MPKAEAGATNVDMLGHIAIGVVVVLIVGLTLGYLARNDWATERRALDARVSNLAAQALMPGSALACLDPIASKGFETGCEKALFATAETTAAAIAFVAAQLSLMASASKSVGRGGPSDSSALTTLRRSVEADRFGIVAYVLAAEHSCTPDRCGAFAFLQRSDQVRVNLVERPFEGYIERHRSDWAAAGKRESADNVPAAPALPASAALPRPPPRDLYFPSSASIPAVNIMTAEPSGQKKSAEKPSDAVTGGSSKVLSRNPTQDGEQAQQPAGATSARPSSAPMQLVPVIQ